MKTPPIQTRPTGFDRVHPPPDAIRRSELAAQYEELLDQVWRCEREWELDDRIALAWATRRRR